MDIERDDWPGARGRNATVAKERERESFTTRLNAMGGKDELRLQLLHRMREGGLWGGALALISASVGDPCFSAPLHLNVSSGETA